LNNGLSGAAGEKLFRMQIFVHASVRNRLGDARTRVAALSLNISL